MGTFRSSFVVLIVVSILNTLFMLNIYNNGYKAMNQIPLQLFTLCIGVIVFFMLMTIGITYTFGSEEARIEKKWKDSDRTRFFLSIGLLFYNILIMWFLAR